MRTQDQITRTVTNGELQAARSRFYELLIELPPHLRRACRDFSSFLEPARRIPIQPWEYGELELTVEGKQHYDMLFSPYAITLLHAYAINLLPANENSNATT